MAVSLQKRLNGNRQEVLDYARTWGIFKAMDKYEVKDYIAFRKFLEAETGNPNFAISPTLGGTGNNNWAEDLLDAFQNKMDRMETRYKELEERYNQLCTELEYYKGRQSLRIEPRIQAILAKCRA